PWHVSRRSILVLGKPLVRGHAAEVVALIARAGHGDVAVDVQLVPHPLTRVDGEAEVFRPSDVAVLIDRSIIRIDPEELLRLSVEPDVPVEKHLFVPGPAVEQAGGDGDIARERMLDGP